MEYWEAVLLGIVQGVTEFLPVSSSGHLVIVGELIRRQSGTPFDPEGNLQLMVAVHLGTLCSILVVYRHDLLRVFRNTRLCGFIGLATLPVVAAGLLFHDIIGEHLQQPFSAGLALLVTAGLLFRAEGKAGETTLGEMNARQAGLIGLFQAIALVPGISRSGSTISAGLLTGLKPEEAARFSFLIAIPAIAGAVVYTSQGLFAGQGNGSSSLPVLVVGATVAFLVGWGSLWWLVGLVRRRQLRWFAWYCAVVGLLTVLWQAAGIIAPK